jgi:hypothetical protein
MSSLLYRIGHYTDIFEGLTTTAIAARNFAVAEVRYPNITCLCSTCYAINKKPASFLIIMLKSGIRSTQSLKKRALMTSFTKRAIWTREQTSIMQLRLSWAK